MTFELSQEARKVQQSHFLTVYNNWRTNFCFCQLASLCIGQLMKMK